jgi:hypothetical protein
MNSVPIGAKIKIKSNEKIGVLLEIFHYPTTFKIKFDDGNWDIYKTHEVEIINKIEEA